MRFRHILVLLLLAASSAPAQPLPDSTAIIGRIFIRNQNIFDMKNSKYNRSFYPLFNRLRFKTRSRVIRRELLFESGERLNAAILEESARNLRRFPFLGSVAINPIPGPHTRSDTVDIVVTTSDQWTTTPDLVVDRRGNLFRLGIGIEEENLLGFGKYFNLRFVTSTDRTLWRTIYKDPRFFGSHWTFDITGIRSNEGKLVDLGIGHPLRSLESRWAFGGRYTYENGMDRLYDNGRLSASVRTHRHRGDLSLTRVWGEQKKHRKLTLGLATENRAFPAPPIVEHANAPSATRLQNQGATERRNVQMTATWTQERLAFIKRRFINKAGLIEDIRTGPSFSMSAGCAYGWRNRRDTYGLLSGSFLESVGIGESHLAIFKAEGKARLQAGRFHHKTLSTFLHYYYQGIPRQTFALGVSYLQLWHPDQPSQLVLGEDVGLRGFPARQFTGDRLFLFNIEDRLFTSLELATLRLGFAAFLDAGMAWPTGQPARWGALAASAGVSLRLGINKGADAPVFRLDLAVPFRRRLDGNRYSISLSFSPIFWSFRVPEATVNRF